MTWMDDAIKEGYCLVKTNDANRMREYLTRMIGVLSEYIERPAAGFVTVARPADHSVDGYKKDVLTTIGKIRALRDEQERALSEKYGLFHLTDSINRLRDSLYRDAEPVKDVVDEIGSVYQDVIDGFTGSLKTWFSKSGSAEEYAHDAKLMISKLLVYRDSLIREANIAMSQGTTAIATASSSSEAVATATSFASACAQLDQVDGLSDEDRKDIREKMNNLDCEKDESMAKHAAKTLIDTVIEKGADALPAIAPFIVQSIKSTLGM